MKVSLRSCGFVLLTFVVGCQQRFIIDVKPGASIKPEDRIAILDESPREFADVGMKVADYLTNKFIGMNVQVVERSLVYRVLKEKGLDTGTATETQLTQAIASAVDASLVGFHKVNSFTNEPSDPEKPRSARRYRVAGLFRIVSMQNNIAIVGGSSTFSETGSDVDSALQSYASGFYSAIRDKLARAQMGDPWGPKPTTQPAGEKS